MFWGVESEMRKEESDDFAKQRLQGNYKSEKSFQNIWSIQKKVVPLRSLFEELEYGIQNTEYRLN